MMQIVKLMGGLANQIRQYVYGRYLEYCTGCQTYFDDSWFFLYHAHNGFELKRVFNLDLALTSECLKDVFQKSLDEKKTIYNVLFELGKDVELVLNSSGEKIDFGGKTISFDINSAFQPISPNKIRYHWTYAAEYEIYYRKIRNIFDSELCFPDIQSKKNRILADVISNTSSVGIHVRHGDFSKVGWLGNPVYYKKCIEYSEKKLNPERFFVFSDDIEYCKKHMKLYGFDLLEDKVEFVLGNHGKTDYIDFQLMSLCKYFIVAPKSSFSSCACVINKRLEEKINWDTIGMAFNDTFGWQREE